jgi:hypothetical protein
LLLAWSASSSAATPAEDAPRLRELRTQRQGDYTYFLARFDYPADTRLPDWTHSTFNLPDRWRPELAYVPALVSQDGKARNVYWRPDANTVNRVVGNQAPTSSEGLQFVGRVQGEGEAKFRLLYPLARENRPAEKGKPKDVAWRGCRETDIVLNFNEAKRIEVPASAAKRASYTFPAEDDLEGVWAATQVFSLALLEARTSDFGFYGFAREATGRKYRVPAPNSWSRAGNRRGLLDRQLYETTTGAAAITESLALYRMTNTTFRDNGQRTVDISRIAGIDIAEHPWKKMMGDKKPAAEPLARLVPNDNYYIHFKQIDKLIELGELMEQWGTTLTQAYEVHSRDYDLKQRYEKQLCLRSGSLGKTFGPLVVRSLAITGNDLYVREGSDVTIIFHVANRKLFLSGVDTFIKEARKEQGSRLQESRDRYHDVDIENFRTPQREVSLHRASIDDFVIYSNSPAALRRVIDTHQGRRRALAEALDFQYMRTIFRLDDEKENGFVFLSDAFIRQMVGPASKIKEKRRLEALTSLQMETHAALFTAWETGKLPDSQKLLLASATLRPEHVYMPEGPGILWDERRNLAVSETYNTIHFATPLVELPIDKVTQQEERDYNRFRLEYLGLWRQYFDPVGTRIGLTDKQVKIDTYILPLVRNSQYNDLRRRSGGGLVQLEPAKISPKAMIQFTTHISADSPDRSSLTDGLRLLGMLGRNKGLDWMGDWAIVRLDDSPVYAKIAEYWMNQEMDPEGSATQNFWVFTDGLIFQVPLTVGVGVKNPLVFAGFLSAIKAHLNQILPDGLEWEPMEPYKDVRMVRIRPKPNGEVARAIPGGEPALYYVLLDGGWYISLRPEPIKDLIDMSKARAKNDDKNAKKPETVLINTSLHLAPPAAKEAGHLLQAYLEWETHRRAVANAPLWQVLYQGNLIPANADDATKRKIAFQYFGFVPVSADGAAYSFDAKSGEVVNARHGSPRRPLLHHRLAEGAPLAKILEQFQTVRADLRFREDGIHTVLSIERK